MKNRGLIWLGILVVGGIASYFTISSGDVVKWNDNVVGIYARYGRAWSSFELALKPYFEDKPVDAAGLDRSFQKYEKDVHQASGEMRRATPPDDELCKSFHASLTQYADLQDAQLIEVKKLIEHVKAHNPGKPEDVEKVLKGFDDLGKKESSLQSVVEGAQQAMAKKFKIKMQ